MVEKLPQLSPGRPRSETATLELPPLSRPDIQTRPDLALRGSPPTSPWHTVLAAGHPGRVEGECRLPHDGLSASWPRQNPTRLLYRFDSHGLPSKSAAFISRRALLSSGHAGTLRFRPPVRTRPGIGGRLAILSVGVSRLTPGARVFCRDSPDSRRSG